MKNIKEGKTVLIRGGMLHGPYEGFIPAGYDDALIIMPNGDICDWKGDAVLADTFCDGKFTRADIIAYSQRTPLA